MRQMWILIQHFGRTFTGLPAVLYAEKLTANCAAGSIVTLTFDDGFTAEPAGVFLAGFLPITTYKDDLRDGHRLSTT